MSREDTVASMIGNERPEPANIVIFGASGDLSKRKLLPALAQMHRWNLLGPHSRITGVVRHPWSQLHWVNYVHDELLNYFPDAVLNPGSWQRIAEKLQVVNGDLSDLEMYKRIGETLHAHDGKKNAVFYLAIPPEWYECVTGNLYEAGLADETDGFRRIVVEKPFGMSLNSARKLNNSVQQYFDESQIYRIDHYLGKESVQNLMVFRFANSVLEPLWNRNYVDHVQITVAESLGIEYRAGYYEKAGALKDMIQSHLLQVMALVAMEAPVSLHADDVRDEKVKVLRAVRHIKPEDVNSVAMRSQYTEGSLKGELLPAYRAEDGVSEDSCIETFAALKIYIDNWRWLGGPLLLRTGKRLPERTSEIAIRFKTPPQKLFNLEDEGLPNNELIFRLQPNEGMHLSMTAKQPGLSTELRGIHLDAPHGIAGSGMPEAYETLLHDVMLGEQGLFSRADEVEECWRIVEPVLSAWSKSQKISTYPAGSMNIPGMDDLMSDCEGGWRDLPKAEMNVHHFASQQALAAAVAEQVMREAKQAITARGVFHWVLAGGTTPRICYEQLRFADIDWSKVHIWFGDERCLPVSDPERNDVMAQQALLNHVAVPESHIHRIAAEQGAVTAARLYAAEIALVEHIDLVLLGMGEDGHTASLFPEHAALDSLSAAVAVFDAPKPPAERVSLGFSQLNRAARRIVMVAGKGKRSAWQQICNGAMLPVTRVARPEWYVTDMDESACD